MTQAAAKKAAGYVAHNFNALAAAGLAGVASNLKEQREQKEYKKKIIAHVPNVAEKIKAWSSILHEPGVLNMQSKKDVPIDFKKKMVHGVLAGGDRTLAQPGRSFFDRGVQQYQAKNHYVDAKKKLDEQIAALDIAEQQERDFLHVKVERERELQQERRRQTDQQMELLSKKIRERTERNIQQKRKEQEKWGKEEHL